MPPGPETTLDKSGSAWHAILNYFSSSDTHRKSLNKTLHLDEHAAPQMSTTFHLIQPSYLIMKPYTWTYILISTKP